MACTCQQNAGVVCDTTLPGICASDACNTARNIKELQSTCQGSDCAPIFPASDVNARKHVSCEDENGCVALYPEDCRNSFWPHFAHPSWLCCAQLYCNN